ncbi:MAG: rhamnosyltransferase WsaF family glycosyltransferase [Actinomycetota bacterium]
MAELSGSRPDLTVEPQAVQAMRYQAIVDLGNPNNSHTLQVELTGREKRVLEIGCGPGHVSQALEGIGCSVVAVEKDAVAAAVAGLFCERVLVGNIESMDLEPQLGDQLFDVILFGDVLEHLVDPAGTMRRLGHHLAKGGFIVASIPNIAHGSVRLALLEGRFRYTESGLLDKAHLRFFTRDSIRELFATCGLRIVEWRTTRIDVTGTELELPDNLPPGLLGAVRSDPEAMVYQYVVKAVPGTLNDLADFPPKSSVFDDLAELDGKREDLAAELQELGSAHMKLLESSQVEAPHRDEVARLIDEVARLGEMVAGLSSELESRLGELEDRRRQVSQAQAKEVQARAELAHADAALFGRAGQLAVLDRELLGKQRALRQIESTWERFHTAAGYRLVEAYSARVGRLTEKPAARRLYDRLAGPARSFMLSRDRSFPSMTEVRRLISEVSDGYPAWIKRSEPDPQELSGQVARSRALACRHLISVIVPVWNPQPELLRRTIDSVRRQTYPFWEMCLANGNSSPEVTTLIEELATEDPRIKFVHLPQNLGISGNTNAALSIACGDYVAFLDQTDLLAPFALFEVASRINKEPQLDVLYSDFDLIAQEDAHRFNPFLPPDWSPELLLSSNYMAHLSVFRRSLVEDAGGVRSDFDGAQDWDLLFRIIESTGNIAHIPRVLYHWRAEEGSAAQTLKNKPYALEAQRSCVQSHLDRIGWPGKVEVEDPSKGLLRVRWSPDQSKKVSVIIPTKFNGHLVAVALRAIAGSSYRNVEVLVVQTGECALKEGWLGDLAGLEVKLLSYREPFNYSAVCNWAAAQATGELLLFFNDDVEPLDPGWLDELVGWAERDEIGVVGARMVDGSGLIQHAGIVIGLNGFADHVFAGMVPGEWSLMGSTDWYRNFVGVTGACLMISRINFDAAGGWREEFALCGGDVDLCLRVRELGKRVVSTPFVRIKHLEGATRAGKVPEGDYFSSFWAYHKYLMGGDPYFNPNLSRSSTAPRVPEPSDPSALSRVSQVIGRQLGPAVPSDRRAECLAMAGFCSVLPEEVEATRRLHAVHRGDIPPRSINWLVPDIDSPFYGGINTTFRLADYFKLAHGVQSRFQIVGSGPERHFRSGMERAFPALAGSDVRVSPGLMSGLAEQPWADVTIATFWMTAYALSKYAATKRKFYLIQDYEPIFYPAGTAYALTEDSYRMGHYGLCNTVSLKEIYEREYGGKGMCFVPSVDRSVFHAKGRSEPEHFRVFLYARPGHDRNCYELAVSALQDLKGRLGRRLEIVTAGSWGTMDGLHDDDFLHHLGLLDYPQTADLYRSCHAGLVLSVSKHPSYLPLEMMASGCLVVTNYNSATTWLLKDERNCLLASPNVQSISACLERALLETDLRSRLVAQALADIDIDHSNWEPEMQKVYEYLCDPDAEISNA